MHPVRDAARRFESLTAQHPKAAGRLRIRTLDIRPGEADTDIVLTLEPEGSPTPCRGCQLNFSNSRCLSLRANQRSVTAFQNQPNQRRPEGRHFQNPARTNTRKSPFSQPHKVWDLVKPGPFPLLRRETKSVNAAIPSPGEEMTPTGRARREPSAPPTSKRHPVKDHRFDRRVNSPRRDRYP